MPERDRWPDRHPRLETCAWCPGTPGFGGCCGRCRSTFSNTGMHREAEQGQRSPANRTVPHASRAVGRSRPQGAVNAHVQNGPHLKKVKLK